MERQARRTRLYVLISLIYGGTAVILLILKQDILYRYHVDPLLISAMAIGSAFCAAAPLLMLYLRGSLSFPFFDRIFNIEKGYRWESTPDDAMDLEKVKAAIQEIRRELSISRKGQPILTDSDKAVMLQALREQFAESLVTELEKQESEALSEKLGLIPIRRLLDSASARLHDGLSALGRRGNLNLVIGTLTTCAAVGLLIYMVLGHSAKTASIPDLLSYYIPRISTVVFVEIFGFFFLRLYKASLSELKYYQNELTTLALISLAVEMAAHEPATSSFTDLARCLVQCDRNRTSPAFAASEPGDDKTIGGAVKIIQELTKLIPTGGKG
jgi:hypothetical protein